MSRSFSLLAALALAACAGSPPAAPAAPLEVRTEPPHLVLTSRDSAPIYFVVFEQQMATMVRWRPCPEPAECRQVEPHGERRLPLDSIPGYKPGATEALLYWWHLVPAKAGGFAFDSVRSLVVPLAGGATAPGS
jgi:hypothetical protein